MEQSAVLNKESKSGQSAVGRFMTRLTEKNPGEKEFHQAVQEVVESLQPVLDKRPEYRQHRILEARSTLWISPGLPFGKPKWKPF